MRLTELVAFFREMRKAHILVWRPEGMDGAGELEINGRKI
jgi:hypothetical protein